MTIAAVHARQLIDCKCRPLVEVEVTTTSGVSARGAAPTGLSVGRHEAAVLRDGDPKEYHGLSVHQAVRNVEEVIAPALIGREIADQRGIDECMIALDGTEYKERLGGNAIYSTSIAVARAAAAQQGQEFYQVLADGPIRTVPVPSFNMINGGNCGDFVQAFNEFLVMPYGARSIFEAVEISIDLFNQLPGILKRKLGRTPQVASSYGFVAPSPDPAEVLGILQEAVDELGYRQEMAFALDCASTEMYSAERGSYQFMGREVSAAELVEVARSLTEQFNLVFIEDLLDEDDWDGWQLAQRKLSRTLLIGDDLIVTNRDRLARALELDCVAGFVLKPNQVGTMTEALDCYHFGVDHGLLAIPSGRSGGVVDDVVMDLSVGLQVPFQKNGAPRSGERIDKLNFLLRVAEKNPEAVLSDVPALVRF